MFDPSMLPIYGSIAMIAVGVLIWGGVRTWRGGDRQKGALMCVAAAVLFGNLLIWTV